MTHTASSVPGAGPVSFPPHQFWALLLSTTDGILLLQGGLCCLRMWYKGKGLVSLHIAWTRWPGGEFVWGASSSVSALEVWGVGLYPSCLCFFLTQTVMLVDRQRRQEALRLDPCHLCSERLGTFHPTSPLPLLCTASCPQPWLCNETRPCHHTHFICQKEARKEAPGCSVLLPSCDCAASGLAQLPGEPHRNENSENNPG